MASTKRTDTLMPSPPIKRSKSAGVVKFPTPPASPPPTLNESLLPLLKPRRSLRVGATYDDVMPIFDQVERQRVKELGIGPLVIHEVSWL
ncbi:hypothetical protein LIER_36674 [Lithospermum erythrorhizon]|uniref:Uncharacterized protein n=1 Tax=Lithospermum erythrorhizon TaxID=34254 RepID=A0AAV3P9A5_LITER